MVKSVHGQFIDELVKSIVEKLEEEKNTVTSYRLEPEDYAERVGYIKALKEIQSDFTRIFKAYFET